MVDAEAMTAALQSAGIGDVEPSRLPKTRWFIEDYCNTGASAATVGDDQGIGARLSRVEVRDAY